MENVIEQNITLKREMVKFMNRFFYSKEKNKENLARVYFYLDDYIRYINNLQVSIGNQLLAIPDFEQVFLEDENVKVYNDTELKTILVDAITQTEKNRIVLDRNEAYRKSLNK